MFFICTNDFYNVETVSNIQINRKHLCAFMKTRINSEIKNEKYKKLMILFVLYILQIKMNFTGFNVRPNLAKED